MTDSPSRVRGRIAAVVAVALGVLIGGSVGWATQTQTTVEATEVVLVDPDTGERLILRLGHSQRGPTLMVELPNGDQHNLIYPGIRVLPLRH